MQETPSFPPLLRGEAAPPGMEPFDKALSAAVTGTDPGLIVYRPAPERLAAAIVFAPEAPLREAMAMVFAAGLGLADALGALAPPEVGVHFDWPTGLRVNGARCGVMRAAASTADPEAEPDWLVIGLDMPFVSDGVPGENPENTVLYEEGCAEVTPLALLESWSRHMLVWVHRWTEDGIAPLHADWRTRAFSMGEEVSFELAGQTRSGTFMGLDEHGGMLLRNGDKTDLLPLTDCLES